MSLRLCTSKIFSSCALQTFLIPLTHNLAKVPPSIVSVAIAVCARRSLSADRLNSTRNGETHKHVRILRRAQTRQLSERSLERSFAAERNPGRVVALSTVKRSVEVHRFNIAHCTTDRLPCCALAAWCKFDSSSLASWAREGTHGNHKMAICSGATKLSIDGERRKKKVGVRAMKTPAMSAPGRAGRGAVDQKFVKYQACARSIRVARCPITHQGILKKCQFSFLRGELHGNLRPALFCAT